MIVIFLMLCVALSFGFYKLGCQDGANRARRDYLRDLMAPAWSQMVVADTVIEGEMPGVVIRLEKAH